jgi:hypothetical protein
MSYTTLTLPGFRTYSFKFLFLHFQKVTFTGSSRKFLIESRILSSKNDREEWVRDKLKGTGSKY